MFYSLAPKFCSIWKSTVLFLRILEDRIQTDSSLRSLNVMYRYQGSFRIFNEFPKKFWLFLQETERFPAFLSCFSRGLHLFIEFSEEVPTIHSYYLTPKSVRLFNRFPEEVPTLRRVYRGGSDSFLKYPRRYRLFLCNYYSARPVSKFLTPSNSIVSKALRLFPHLPLFILSLTLTIVPVIGATAEPWEAPEGPPLRNLGTGRRTLWQPSWI